MFKHAATLSLIATACISLSACASTYLKSQDFDQPYHFSIDEEAKIERNDENIEVLKMVQSYRDAISSKDSATLKGMIASDYYENASTTDQLDDDYGKEKLDEILDEYLGQAVKDIRYIIEIKQVIKEGMRYFVDYQYIWNFRYEVAGQSYWQSNNDTNRITLVREDGELKIQSGL